MKNISNVISNLDEVKLDHSFQDACSDKEFYDYVYSLGIAEDTLKKYTSSLEDSFEEYKNCKNCPGLEECPNKVHGYKYSPEKDQNLIRFSYIACKKQEKKYHDDAYKENLELFCLPKEIKEASLKNLYKDDKARLPIIKYFKEFIDSYTNKEKAKGLYLTGSFGSGKTYMIAALFNEMAKKGVQSALIYYPEFLRSLKSSFQTNYSEKFDYIKKVPLLLLDDIGAENCSAWSRDEVLGPILQYRMEQDLPTFFTSNLTMDELEQSLAITTSGADKVKARRIVERIKQLTVTLELISKNRRN
ncbi:MAG: primosomal protein DnaI [Tenericutes bacterium]|nr:primosomal protein DnaI [Mycoplasmatota bacterium]MDD6941363.1 primosomal protein DnaI [bacterium]MDY2697833.1 primosomal protein DnaI [Bacilli bacterium]